MNLLAALVAATLSKKSYEKLTEKDKKKAVRLSQSFAPKKK